MKKNKDEELNKENQDKPSKEKEEKVKETPKKEKTLEEQILELTSKVAYWQNKYYEAYADMDNLRKTMEKDHQQMVKYRGQGFLEALLPVFDNFYNCFKFKPDDPKLAAYCQGFQMIYTQLENALQSEGVREILPKVGDKFSHETMQAVDIVDGEEDDIIVNVSNKGYFLKDRLVRPAMVVVSKKPQEKKETTKDNEENKTEENTSAN
jgi:molecular chaperone GrpE